MIKARIRSYERSLRVENCDDSYGKRYLIGPMYLLLNDVPGAMKHYEWFQGAYSDDVGDPYDALCWALALYLGDEKKKAEERLRAAIFVNLYLVPHLLDIELKPYPIWHGGDFSELEYAAAMPRELKALWTKDALDWARDYYLSPMFQSDLTQYVQLEEQVNNEPFGPHRNELLRKAWTISDPRKLKVLDDGLPTLHVIKGGKQE